MTSRLTPTLLALSTFLLSFASYFYKYEQPNALFWDENYHIPAAEKYLQGVFFLEQHPPLGKLLIALGEYSLNPNKDISKNSFLSASYIKKVPKGYSFRGVRLAPVLAAQLSIPIAFILFYLLSSSSLVAFFFSCLLLLDNALIVHSRGAMLEPIQLLFCLMTLAYAMWCYRRHSYFSVWNYGVLGALTGLALSVKFTSAILFLVPLGGLYHESPLRLRGTFRTAVNKISKYIVYLSSALIVLLGSYYIHYITATKVVKNQYYDATKEHKKLLKSSPEKWRYDPKSFYTFLVSSVTHTAIHNQGVPALKYGDKNENGSHPLLWPVGAKSISYRWEKTGDGTVRYLRLQINPLVWAVGLTGVVLSTILVASHHIYGLSIRYPNLYPLIFLFLLLYTGYMGAMLCIPRVMYLYHYFLPLLFSLILACLIFSYLYDDSLRSGSKTVLAGLAVFTLSTYFCYQFFSPFTYYTPLSEADVVKRMWTGIWEIGVIKP